MRRDMINRTAGVFLAATTFGLLLPAGTASANPVAAELGESFELMEGGDRVEVSFLGIMNVADYDQYLLVQWNVDGTWKTSSGSRTVDGTEEANGGSGVETYNRLTRVAPCPAAGDQLIRLVYQDEDDPEDLYEWTGATITCEAAGQTDGEPDSGCAVAGSPGAVGPVPGLLAIVAGAVLLLRRRRGR